MTQRLTLEITQALGLFEPYPGDYLSPPFTLSRGVLYDKHGCTLGVFTDEAKANLALITLRMFTS